MMRVSLRSRISIDPDAQRRKQYALASMLASEDFDCAMYPKRWQHRFNRSLKVIQQFDKEFEERA